MEVSDLDEVEDPSEDKHNKTEDYFKHFDDKAVPLIYLVIEA